jgi:adenylate cyclase
MKYLTSIWATFALIALLCFIRLTDGSYVEQIRLIGFDSYIKTLPEQKSERIVLLNISEESLEAYGQFPWPRQYYAQLISDLRNKNAGMIAFTIMFPEDDRFGGDETFASWIKDNGIILSQDADEYGRSTKAPYVGYATFGTADPMDWIYRYKGLVTNIESLESNAWGVGLINGSPEVDGVTRRVPLMSQINNEVYPSLSLEVLRAINRKKSYTIKTTDNGIESVVLRPFEINTDSDGSVWLQWNTVFEEVSYTGASSIPDLEGKTVVVGVTAKGLANQISTPDGLKYPHQLQATALQTLLSDKPISRPIWADAVEIMVASFGALLIALSIYYLPIYAGIAVFVAAAAGSAYASWYAWYEFQILLDLSATLILYILSLTSASFNNFYIQFKLRQQIKKQFETYLDPRQVYLLQKNPELLRLGGERKDMSFMFMDIVGFTPISEHYKNNDDPEGLVKLINNYLDTMSKIILKNGGTIDKYMGDCIMAFWNAPLECPNHADAAVNTAVEILEAADELIQELEDQGLPRIDIGIGINTGACIVGNMGSESRFDYSVIGDAVNLGARLEGQTRNYDGVRVLLSQFTAGASSERSYRKVDSIKVKGKTELIDIYTVD